jgi:hypothetical protein
MDTVAVGIGGRRAGGCGIGLTGWAPLSQRRLGLSELRCQHLAAPPTSFLSFGRMTARLQDASRFLENITGDRGWESARAVLEDRVVLRKYAHGYDDLSRTADDCLDDVRRSKEELSQHLTSGFGDAQEAAEEQEGEGTLEQS